MINYKPSDKLICIRKGNLKNRMKRGKRGKVEDENSKYGTKIYKRSSYISD